MPLVGDEVPLGEKLCELDVNQLEKSQTTKITYLDEYQTNDTPEWTTMTEED